MFWGPKPLVCDALAFLSVQDLADPYKITGKTDKSPICPTRRRRIHGPDYAIGRGNLRVAPDQGANRLDPDGPDRDRIFLEV